MSQRLLIAFLFFTATLFSSFAHGYQACPKTKEIEDKCKADGDGVISKYQSDLAAAKASHKEDMNGMSGAMGIAATSCTGGIAAAAKACREKQSECSSCAPMAQEGTCKKKAEAAAVALDNQAGSCAGNAIDSFNTKAATDSGTPPPSGTPPGGETPPPQNSGGSDSLMPMLMGAGLGAMAGMMMAKDDKDKDKDKDKKDPEEDEKPRDPADCNVAAGANDSRCNAELESKCSLTPELPVCAIFIARYCGNKPTPQPGTDNIETTSTEGEGKDSPFCKDQSTVAFCKENGRATCISCVELDRKKGPACKADPASCVAQYSQNEIDAAKQSCPIDPKFSDPNFSASTGGAGVPTVVLPQSVSRGPASDIAGQYSASVFSVSTGVFKKMCDQGRLNCPK